MFRTLTRGELAFDLGGSAALFAVFWAWLVLQGAPAISVVVLFGMCVSLAFWRLWPGMALAVAWTTALMQMLALASPMGFNLAILVVLFATSAFGGPVVRWLGFASAIVGAAAVTLYTVVRPWFYENQYGGETGLLGLVIPQVVWFVVVSFTSFGIAFLLSWTLGLLSRSWRIARESRRASALAIAQREAAQREVLVEQERNRIARDMHDVVAHSLAVVVAQADGARYAAAGNPSAVDEALIAISTTAREALGDVRQLLGQLRHNQEAGPQPVLLDLDRLVDQIRASGLTITVDEQGERGLVSAAQELAVYRIVQESLTNALRHGDRSVDVVIELTWTPYAIEIVIVSALLLDSPAPEMRHGHGLAGMSERASLVGGALTTKVADGWFTVAATLPRQTTSQEGIA